MPFLKRGTPGTEPKTRNSEFNAPQEGHLVESREEKENGDIFFPQERLGVHESHLNV